MLKKGVQIWRKVKVEKLEKRGYKKVPNHSYSDFQPDEQWISRTDELGRSLFPRYHVVRYGKKWFIHYDYILYGEHKTSVSKNENLIIEINRIT